MKKGRKVTLKRWSRRVAKICLALGIAGSCVVLYANLTPTWASRGRLFDKVSELPQTKVGLVLGTSDKMSDGRDNLYFRYRIDAAVDVWNSGKVETLIVSGDNLSDPPYYNEPGKMRRALVKRGVPEVRIVSDPRGMRTLDSVIRAKEVFGTNTLLFISQRFHNERAIYLARANGIQAYGFNARDVDSHTGLKTRIREVGARVKMWLDVNFLNTRPSHLDTKIELPE